MDNQDRHARDMTKPDSPLKIGRNRESSALNDLNAFFQTLKTLSQLSHGAALKRYALRSSKAAAGQRAGAE